MCFGLELLARVLQHVAFGYGSVGKWQLSIDQKCVGHTTMQMLTA
jgi:hypothetical protein